VWPHPVVIDPPTFDGLSCIVQVQEPVLVQAFLAELSMEALDVAVLHGPAWRDEERRIWSRLPCRAWSRVSKAWFDAGFKRLSEAQLVFLDPDTGLAGKRVRKYGRNSVKYVFEDEVQPSGALAQTPSLQMNVVYVCKDGQSFKVFSCDNTTGACDYQNYKNGQAHQRGQALRVELAVLLPAKCHAQTPAEAQADPHRGEIPPAPSPFKARATGTGSSAAANSQALNSQPVNSQAGAGAFKVGDTVRVLIDGWQEAGITQVHGRSYVVHLPNGIDVSKLWPIEVRRLGKLTAEDHAMGQYDLHDRVQVLVNSRWMEGEIRGQNLNMYDIKVPGVDTGFGSDIVNTTPENIRMSTTAAAAPAQRASGQAPKAGLTSCAGKYEGRWEHVSGMAGMTVVFRGGKVTVTEGLGGPMEFECWTGDGQIVMYKAGSYTPFSYGFDINNDGTLQTPLGAIKKMGN
jgi:hypothetical protein